MLNFFFPNLKSYFVILPWFHRKNGRIFCHKRVQVLSIVKFWQGRQKKGSDFLTLFFFFLILVGFLD
jgi:hypothetical protein